MIDPRVGHDEIVDLEDFSCAQIWGNDCLARIKISRCGSTGVDHHYFGARQFNDGGVALPDIEMGNPQFRALAPLYPPVGGVCSEQTKADDQCNRAMRFSGKRKQTYEQTVEQGDLQRCRRRYPHIGKR